MATPKPEFKLKLDFSSLLGPLFYMWVVQMLLPIFLLQVGGGGVQRGWRGWRWARPAARDCSGVGCRACAMRGPDRHVCLAP
jgi:hypothetical protein